MPDPARNAQSALDVEKEVARKLAAKEQAGHFDVFMAHNSLDKETVLAIARALRKRGIYPWVDVEQIAPGRAFQDVLETTITRVKAAAIFCGRHGFGRWQVFELRALVAQCVEREIPVIPVLMSGVDAVPAELVFLRQLHAVRLERPDDAHALAQLQWGITGERGTPV